MPDNAKTETPAAEATPKGRSPGYPAIDLGTALAKAQELYTKQGRQLANMEIVLKNLGYGGNSGAGRQVLSALLKFGLLVDSGSAEQRRGALSDLALRVILPTKPDSQERVDSLRIAALTPTIHREMWDHFSGSIPNDDTVRGWLTYDKKFTEPGAAEFVSQFRRTLATAKLDGSVIVAPPPENNTQTGGNEVPMTPPAAAAPPARPAAPFLGLGNPFAPAPAPQPAAGEESYRLPLSPGRAVTLRGVFPITEDEWTDLQEQLKAMKRGLVVRPAPPPPSKPPDAEGGAS